MHNIITFLKKGKKGVKYRCAFRKNCCIKLKNKMPRWSNCGKTPVPARQEIPGSNTV